MKLACLSEKINFWQRGRAHDGGLVSEGRAKINFWRGGRAQGKGFWGTGVVEQLSVKWRANQWISAFS
jgi:hypothetical protein